VNLDSTGPAKGQDNRRRIIEAADQLFYSQGYNSTSFSDIARASGLPRGNFYYYFKSKDDILAGVVDQRLQTLGDWLQHCEASGPRPIEQLRSFVGGLTGRADEVARYGCPLGTLSSELGKQQLGLKTHAAELFGTVVTWLSGRFEASGKDADAAHDLALQLVSRTQGASVVAQVYNDPGYLRRELGRIADWLDEL
jgi:AcrR family transcriptional regulator